VNADPALVHRGRWVNLTFTLGVGDIDYLITVQQGKIIKITQRTLQTVTGRFSIRADAHSWRKHWQKSPQRDYHDIFAMLAKDIVHIDGDLLPLMQNLQYFKDLISKNRES
jgi:acyl-CoA hydrolase